MDPHDMLVDFDRVDQRPQIGFAERYLALGDVGPHELAEAGKLVRIKPSCGGTLILDPLQR